MEEREKRDTERGGKSHSDTAAEDRAGNGSDVHVILTRRVSGFEVLILLEVGGRESRCQAPCGEEYLPCIFLVH